MLLHATSIAITQKAVLLVGPAGSGKSDLALRLIDGGAELISDDQTEIKIEGEQLIATVPSSIAGLMEVRHVGLMQLPYLAAAPVALYVELVPTKETLERLPEKDSIFLLDHAVRRLRLPAYAASTPAKIRAFLLYPLVTDNDA